MKITGAQKKGIPHGVSGGNPFPRIARASGFTLVELMMTIVVVAVLVAVAVPSFQYITVSSRLTTTTNKLVSALHTARLEAIKRNQDTRFCSGETGDNSKGNTTLGSQCKKQVGAVYTLIVDTSGSQDTKQVLAGVDKPSGDTRITKVKPLKFSSAGLAYKVNESDPYDKAVAIVCTDAIKKGSRRTIEMVTGSTIHTRTSDDGCP